MQVIYLDLLVGTNFIADYFILAATARIGGFYSKQWRLLLGALIGAAYAAFVVFPAFSVFNGTILRLAVGIGISAIAFGCSAGMIKRTCLLFLTAFAFAGLCMAIYFLTGTQLLRQGVYYISIPFRVLVACFIAAYVCSGWLFRGMAKHGAIHNTLEEVTITFADHTERFTLLYDTGNDLSDPVTNRPVLVLERRAAARLLPARLLFLCTALEKENCAALFHRLPAQDLANFRLLPYRALGTANGMLLMLRPQAIIRANGKAYDAYVALSPNPIADGRYDGLIGL